MKRLGVIALLLVLLGFPSRVRADISPPIFPPGSNPQPSVEGTQVRMVAETVLIEVQRDITPESLGRARVTADFTMHNTGTAEESMAVRFPIAASDGRFGYPEISNLLIQVDGRQVQYRRASYPDIRYMDENVPWAEFDVAFPAGQDVAIRVAYDLQGSGYYPYTAFYYILETGAGWKDTIGSADVILRLPYEAGPENVILNTQIGWGETTPGGTFEGKEFRWHFDEFEPGAGQPVQNMEFVLVAPPAWEAVLTARASVEKNPEDGEAWGRLGKAYKDVFFLYKSYREDDTGQELYRQSVEAYEKCLVLKPEDAQWHAGFADLLGQRAMWDSWMSGTRPEAFRAVEEIHTALQLAPDDPVVREIAANLVFMVEDGIEQNGDSFDFPWLTKTPIGLRSAPATVPVDELTATPLPPAVIESTVTSSPLPAASDTPQPEPTRAEPVQANATQTSPTAVPGGRSPVCGSAALVPLIALIWIASKRRQTM